MARCKAVKNIVYADKGQVPAGSVGDLRGLASSGEAGSYSVHWNGGLYSFPGTGALPGDIQLQDTDGDDIALTD